MERFGSQLAAFSSARAARTAELLQRYRATMLLTGDLSEAEWRKQHASLVNHTLDGQNALQPWLETEKKLPAQTLAEEAVRLEQVWQDYFGKYDDPETQAKIKATVEFLNANHAGS